MGGMRRKVHYTIQHTWSDDTILRQFGLGALLLVHQAHQYAPCQLLVFNGYLTTKSRPQHLWH
jgi:hypothetical protein